MENTDLNRPSVIMGLAFCAGIGLTLMMVALGIGVTQGDAANLATVNLTFMAGLVMLITGSIGWFAIVQPQRHFDDINQPAADEHHDTHAIVPADDHAVTH